MDRLLETFVPASRWQKRFAAAIRLSGSGKMTQPVTRDVLYLFSRCRRLLVFVALLLVLMARPAAAQIDSASVKRAIDRGTAFLVDQQQERGNWSENATNPGGVTALCTLALLESGLTARHPAVSRALAYLRSFETPGTTYSTSLHLMVMAKAAPRTERLRIARYAKWLVDAQNKRSGGWSYHSGPPTDDPSNSQFALLALHQAERVGVTIPLQTWRLAQQYWQERQQPSGAWSYNRFGLATGSMTCAGIASLVITSQHARQPSASIVNGQVQCCGDVSAELAVEKGLDWLGLAFSVQKNPGSSSYFLYYMYGMERVGRMTGQRFLGRFDWYRQGADSLVKRQDKLDGSWRAQGNALVNSAFALLFLSKGRRPVVISKLRYGDPQSANWNKHPSGIHNLTRFVEARWQQDLTWQTTDIQVAQLTDLMESPVLFISGYQSLQLDEQEKTNLRNYVNQGGFLLVESCCGDAAFDSEFRLLMKEMFPESPLTTLPPDHAIWFAQDDVDPKFVGRVEGIQSCCRTSVVYLPDNLSCYWDLYQHGRRSEYPEQVQQQLDAHIKFGGNVIAYATNRELKRKLDRPLATFQETDVDSPLRGTLFVPKLSHGGGGNDAPNSLTNLLGVMRLQLEMRVSTKQQLVQPTDKLTDYPLLFLHGRRDFQLNEQQRQALGTYIRRGGFVFADAICASEEFASAFRREMKEIFPDQSLVNVAAGHPLLRDDFGGYDVTKLTLRDPAFRDAETGAPRATLVVPLLEGLTLDGRLAVIFSPHDLSCALENQTSPECKGYSREDATRLGSNIILFGLQQ